MASVDELVTGLRAVVDKISEAVAGADAAKSTCEEIIAQMAVAGIQDKAAEFTAVKTAIEALQAHLTSGTDLAERVAEQARRRRLKRGAPRLARGQRHAHPPENPMRASAMPQPRMSGQHPDGDPARRRSVLQRPAEPGLGR